MEAFLARGLLTQGGSNGGGGEIHPSLMEILQQVQ